MRNSNARTGGIIEQEGYIHLSNVMLVDAEANSTSRTRTEFEEGRRRRVFTRSGAPVPETAGS